MPNRDLLLKTLDHIEHLEAFRKEGLQTDTIWYQPDWAHQVLDAQGEVCGTAMCFAGHAVTLAGERIEFANRPCDCGCGQVSREARMEGGGCISERARILLGLHHGQASRLFYGRNTIADLRRQVADLASDEAA